MSAIRVRPYAPGDRAGVRGVCFATGYMGEPVDWLWADARSFADMWSGWYTDCEPESAWVADLDGRVVGYLLGCRDSRRSRNPALIAAHHAFARGLLVRPGTAGFMWRAIWDVICQGGIPHLIPDLTRWPAHLHTNLLPVARGKGIGRRLMQNWLDTLRGTGVPGVHLGTIAENTRAVAFFTAIGFRRHGSSVPIPGFRSRTGSRLHNLTMVQDIRP